MLRRQPPVHSPVTWRAIAAGFGAALGRGPDEESEAELRAVFLERYGARDLLFTDSGTSALRLAIAGAVARRSGPIALPGYGCFDLATAAEGAGARVVLYDLDAGTLGPDLDSLRAVGDRAPAVIVVAHLFGYPVDVAAASEALGGALVIEDAAQGAGGLLRGRLLGSLGCVSVLSFGRGKGMTGGGGGALLAHDDEGCEIVGWARARLPPARRRGVGRMVALAAQLLLGRPMLYGIPASLPFLHLGETRYHPPRPPEPASASMFSALRRVLEESEREVRTRRDHATRLLSALHRSSTFRAVRVEADFEPGYLRLPALVTEAARESFPAGEGASLGIMPMYPRTLASLPSLHEHLTEPQVPLPGSAELARSLVSLPTHGLLNEADLRAIEDFVRRDH